MAAATAAVNYNMRRQSMEPGMFELSFGKHDGGVPTSINDGSGVFSQRRGARAETRRGSVEIGVGPMKQKSSLKSNFGIPDRIKDDLGMPDRESNNDVVIHPLHFPPCCNLPHALPQISDPDVPHSALPSPIVQSSSSQCVSPSLTMPPSRCLP